MSFGIFVQSFADAIVIDVSAVADPGTPVAVQVNCMDVLYNLRGHEDWIADELKQQTEFLLRNASPALLSRGKRILLKLKQKRK